jgi:hypothetical protein
MVVYQNCNPNPKDDHEKSFLNGNKDDNIGVMTTYILRDIWFHLSGIHYRNEEWNKLKKLFDKVNEKSMQLEKFDIYGTPLIQWG